MKHSDFEIGKEFMTATGRWRCTDKGTRTIVAIHVENKQQSELAGPPYAISEMVFDEYDFEGCYPAPLKHSGDALVS